MSNDIELQPWERGISSAPWDTALIPTGDDEFKYAGDSTFAYYTLYIPGILLSDLYVQAKGKPEALLGIQVPERWANGVTTHTPALDRRWVSDWSEIGLRRGPRCRVCNWRAEWSGHRTDNSDGMCPDLFELKMQYETLGKTIQQIADEFGGRPYSWVRQRLEWAEVELRPRGRSKIA